ncbi:MAG: GC-type dockerin domain-anchored protein [Phycisphaerales bacterium]
MPASPWSPWRFAAGSFAWALCVPVVSFAQVTPVSQQRSLLVRTNAGGSGCSTDSDSASDSSNNFDFWYRSISISSASCGASITADAAQSSRILGDFTSVQATVGFSGPGHPNSTFFFGDTTSLFGYTFTVASDTAYYLSGTGVHATSVVAATGQAEVSLVRGSVSVYLYRYMGFGTSEFRTSGVLSPGTYTLSARASFTFSEFDRFAGGGSASIFAQFWAGTTCPADFNADQVVNSQDFFDFLTAFLILDPGADFNHDTALDSQDFFDFINAFVRGC